MRWLVVACASGDVVGVDTGHTLSISRHAQGEMGTPCPEQLEEHLPAARSFYYSYIFGSIGTLNRLHDAGHHQHRLGGEPVHINNIIAICYLRASF